MSIRKRNGKYLVKVEAGRDPITGQRKRRYATCEDEDEAKIKEAELIKQVRKGIISSSANVTVGDHLLEWLKEDCNDLAPRTYSSYEMIVKKHLIPLLGNIKIQKLNPKHIQKYQNYKLKEGKICGQGGLSARTVQYHHRILSRALKIAVRWQIIDENPCKYVDAPSVKKPDTNALSVEQVGKILKAAKGSWIYEIILIALYTGMRRGEILGLRWKDIDFKNKEIKVRQQAQRIRNHKVILRELKTDSSRREIYIPDHVVCLLDTIKKKQAKPRLKLGSLYKKHDLVFCYGNGEPRNPEGVSKKFKRLLEQAEIDTDFRFHDMRHTFATLTLEEGTAMKTLQKILGHTKYHTTADTYSHVTDKMKKEAADSISRALKRADGDNMATNG